MPDPHPSDAPRISFTEAERSAALHAYDLLDTPREQDFDDLTRIAAEVCGTPIAVVNLVDTTRQFFKAEVGLGVRETPLETSFCGHAILEEEMMVVPDAQDDPRFACNPLVTGISGLRFYAGALLKTPDGLPVGTMCVLDFRPRHLDEHQIRTLRLLARQAMTQMELRRSLSAQRKLLGEVRSAEARHRQIADSATDFAIITMDLRRDVTSWSVGAERILGWTEAEMRGAPADIFFTAEDTAADAPEREMIAARDTGRGSDERWHLRKDGSRFWASGEMMPLMDDHDQHIGYLKILRDRTAQRALEEQRIDLTRELSHRMKNTFAMVQAIVTQTFRTASSLDAGREAISGRLAALARAQDILTATSGEAADIRDVVEAALQPHLSGEGRISATGPKVLLTSQRSLGLSLALHELATNATKYGSLSREAGRVDISWEVPSPDQFLFEWKEYGGATVEAPETTGFGSRLIERVVASYFNGTAKLRFDPGGVQFRLEGTLGAEA